VLSSSGNNGNACGLVCTAANGWSYYADPADNTRWIFAIRKNGNTFTAEPKVHVNGSSYTSANGGVGHENGSYLINRYWNVNLTSGSITTPVDVKFYYDPADSIAAENARKTAADAVSCPAAQRTAWRWFKSTGSDFSPTNVLGNRFNFSNITLTPAAYGSENGVQYVEFDGIASFSGGGGGVGFNNNGTSGVGLPVKLISFTAQAIDNQYISTNWITASEVDNKGFNLERSTDGKTFESIAWIDGNGSTTEQKQYGYQDKKTVPNTIYYYRLKQIDFDGKFEYSDIVSATFIGESGFAIESLRPNPATNDKVAIQLISNTDVAATVEMTDMLGRKVLSEGWAIATGFNGHEIDLSSIAGGTYTVTVHSAYATSSKRLVVTK
jgi:hypothetical protein